MTDTRTVVNRHPVRGAIWGFVLGLGITVYLILFSVIGIATVTGTIVTAVIIAAVFAALGALWGMFGPAKKPKEPSGGEPTPAPAATESDES